MRMFKVEGIPNFAAGVYAWIAKNNPCIKDYHEAVISEICSKASTGRLRLLDIGTGPGYVPIEIAKRCPDIEVTGIDLSSKMIELADKNAQAAGLSSRVKFQVANAGALPFEDSHFDIIISTLSFHHWANPAAYIDELWRCLKTGGHLCIYDLLRDTTSQINAEMRRKYGWFLSFLFLNIVRAHSSIELSYAEGVLSSVKANFSKKIVQGEGVIISLQLVK